MISFDKAIEFLNQVVIVALAKEFEAEGHKMTGKLIDDIETVTTNTAEGFVQDYLIYKYGAYLHSGVKADRIPFNPGSGAKKSLYIEGLMRYVKMRMGISELRQQKSVAFAIAYKQKQVGMPIRTRGMGTHWIMKATQAIEEKIPELFGDFNEHVVITNIDELISKWNKDLTN